MKRLRYPAAILAGALTLAFCIGVVAYETVPTITTPTYDINAAGRESPPTTRANNQCKQTCDYQAGQCNMKCSQGPNALQCSQQCTATWQQCMSSCGN